MTKELQLLSRIVNGDLFAIDEAREYIHTVQMFRSSPELIIELVCNAAQIPINKLRRKDRHKYIVMARHVCCYFCRRYSNAVMADIARLTGNEDHTTVVHSVKVVNNMIATNNFEYCHLINRVNNYISEIISNETNNTPTINHQRHRAKEARLLA